VKLPVLFSRFVQPVRMVIFPSLCKICRRPLEGPEEKAVCSECLMGVEVHRGPVCPVCGRFLFYKNAASFCCFECQTKKPSFSRHRSLGPYTGRLKEMIILFKYKEYEILSRPLAALLYENFGSGNGLFSEIDFILSVPLYPRKERARGFNQAESLARQLSKLSGLPVLNRTLVKIKNTPAQVSLEAKERELNLRGAFAVRKQGKIRGRKLLLIDDVFTTGTTVSECAAVLHKAGAKEIRALTLARA